MLTTKPYNSDHDNVYVDGKRVGFYGHHSKCLALEKCPKCGLENYAMNVLSGVCTWCGYDLNGEPLGEGVEL